MSSETERDAFYAACAEFADCTGHKPSMLDVWLMGRGVMGTNGRAALPAEPPRPDRLSQYDETDRLIRLSDALAVVPGGNICDPQQLADELRLIPAAEPPRMVAGDGADEVKSAFELHLNTLPAPMQVTIRGCMTRGESNSWEFWRLAWDAGQASERKRRAAVAQALKAQAAPPSAAALTDEQIDVGDDLYAELLALRRAASQP